ncbi:MAG: transporter substrate-binding domain-containing protein [Spirochaetes bacterium]|nr:transporter substrate-binding domain-containing protein [Spirochaetota bacterium]
MLLSFPAARAEGNATVRVGAFNYYPGIFLDVDGKVKGFYVDALAEVGRERGIDFEYVWGTWNEGLERIKDGSVDLLTSVAYTPERERYLDYGEEPLLTVWSELYVGIDSDIRGITDFEGKRVALMKGDYNAQNFRTLVDSLRITVEILEEGSFEDVFKAIVDGRADGGVVNCTFGAGRQRQYGIRSTGVIFNPFDIFFAVAEGKNAELLSTLDGYLETWKHQQSSVYSLARQRWTYGETSLVQAIPRWVVYVAAGMLLLLGALLSFSILLRSRVRRATRELSEREAKLRSYIENDPEGIFVVDSEGRYLEANPAAQRLTGYTERELRSLSVIDLQPRSTAEEDMRYFRALKEKGSSKDEFSYRRKDGEIRRWSLEGVKLSDDRYLGFARDITDRVRADLEIKSLLEEKEILLKEVHHRIKNNMNTIRGLLQLQKDALRDSPAFSAIQDAENRVQSMIVLYDKLYCSENYRELSAKAYLESLAPGVLGTFPRRADISLVMDVQDFSLNVQYLAPLGILCNELMTNSMKHAFAGRDSGTITISASSIDGVVTVLVRDDGIGMTDPASAGFRKGFGLDLVDMLMRQLDGTLAVEVDGGTSCTLRFPVA